MEIGAANALKSKKDDDKKAIKKELSPYQQAESSLDDYFEMLPKNISILRLDTDWYESTKENYLLDR